MLELTSLLDLNDVTQVQHNVGWGWCEDWKHHFKTLRIRVNGRYRVASESTYRFLVRLPEWKDDIMVQGLSIFSLCRLKCNRVYRRGQPFSIMMHCIPVRNHRGPVRNQRALLR